MTIPAGWQPGFCDVITRIEYALELARRARQIALDGNHALAEQIREVMDAAFDKAEQDLP